MNEGPTGERTNRRDLLKLLGVAPVFGYVTSEDVAATSRQELDVPHGSLTGTSVSVALRGDVALVGTPASWTGDGTQVGSVTAYRYTAGSWEHRVSLTPRADGTHFGSAVALDGSTALVGDPLSTRAGTTHSGRVAVFTSRGGSWTRATTLTRQAATGVDRFGGAIELDRSTALIAASTATTDRGFRSGAVCVFSQASGSWVRRTTLHPDPGADRFGTAVALDDETVAVGARRRGESSPVPAGEVTLFERSGGRWSRQTTLHSPESGRNDEFGTSLALDGDTLLVGAPTDSNDRGSNAGAVHVFNRTSRRWRHQQTVLATEGVADNQFGTTLALNGDVAMVGRRARARPAILTRTDGRWDERGIPMNDEPTRTRTAVALDGTRALVGVADSPDSASGTATVFGV